MPHQSWDSAIFFFRVHTKNMSFCNLNQILGIIGFLVQKKKVHVHVKENGYGYIHFKWSFQL